GGPGQRAPVRGPARIRPPRSGAGASRERPGRTVTEAGGPWRDRTAEPDRNWSVRRRAVRRGPDSTRAPWYKTSRPGGMRLVEPTARFEEVLIPLEEPDRK